MRRMNKFLLPAVVAALQIMCQPALAGGPVTTLDQQLAIWNQVIAQVQNNPASLPNDLAQLVPQYGQYCGLQQTPPGALPIDCLDLACMEHDLSPAYSLPDPTIEQIGQADQHLIADLYLVQPTTPYGQLYKQGAIELFQAKITYEQANKVSLITNCSDCLEPSPLLPVTP